MRRDLDLCRFILMRVEESSAPVDVRQIPAEGHSYEEFIYQVVLLQDAGLIEALLVRSDSSDLPLAAKIERLTWKGHEFLSDARDESIWNRAKKEAGEASLAVVQAILTALAKKALGLP